MQKTLLVLALISIALLFSGAKKKEYYVGVTLLTRDVFYQQLEEGLKEEAKASGVTLRVQSAEKDLNTQTSQIENFITQRVDALVICPVDSIGVGSVIERANKRGIPVFTADIRSEEGKVVCHIASNNHQGGVLAGEHLTKMLGGKGEVAIIDHPEVASVQERVRGFKDAVKEHPEMKIVDQPSAQGDRDRAMVVMQNMLLSHPDIKGIFAVNDNCALGALAALEAAGRQDVVIVGFDATPEAQQAIKEGGALKADVIQYPIAIGRTTIQTIVRHLSGQEVPLEIPIDTGIVDKESLEKAAGPAHATTTSK
ncbi:MAG: substrate-binding domain-containing protein [Candidatus Brocadiales bacterium]